MPPPDDNAQCFVHMVRIENFETRIDKSFNHYPLTINFSYLLLAQKAWFFSIFSCSSLLLSGHGHNKSCRVCECSGPSQFYTKECVNSGSGEYFWRWGYRCKIHWWFSDNHEKAATSPSHELYWGFEVIGIAESKNSIAAELWTDFCISKVFHSSIFEWLTANLKWVLLLIINVNHLILMAWDTWAFQRVNLTWLNHFLDHDSISAQFMLNWMSNCRFNWMSSDLERQSMTYIYAHNARERNEKEEGLGIFICSF